MFLRVAPPGNTAAPLAALVRTQLRRKMHRGMRVSEVSAHTVLLEDLEEWSWTEFAALQWASPHELTADIHAAKGRALPGLAVLVTARARGMLSAGARALLCVAFYVCTAAWLACVCGADLRQLLHMPHHTLDAPDGVA